MDWLVSFRSIFCEVDRRVTGESRLQAEIGISEINHISQQKHDKIDIASQIFRVT